MHLECRKDFNPKLGPPGVRQIELAVSVETAAVMEAMLSAGVQVEPRQILGNGTYVADASSDALTVAAPSTF